MAQLTKQTTELIVDVLSLFHFGEANYSDYATEQGKNERSKISARMKDLKKQGIPGIEAVRQAKIEWILRITTDQA
jgi:hypothetical protein